MPDVLRRVFQVVVVVALLPLLRVEAVPVGYPFAHSTETLDQRITPPAGTERIELKEGSFGGWLRHLPLLPAGSPVHLFDGTLKSRQDVHAAVLDLDVGKRDLQQCADAVMRLRAEYLFASGQRDKIAFHPDPGKKRALTYSGGADRDRFAKYLTRVFVDAGSASLQAELVPVGAGPILPGDVLIQGGYPGHAVLVLDVAQARGGSSDKGANRGKRYLLLGQSYMPAQQFHVIKNLGDGALSPWYDADSLSSAGLQTPEWRPFRLKDVRRFP